MSLPINLLSYILSYTNLDIIKRCYLICHQFKKAIDNDLLWILLFKKYNKEYTDYQSLYKLTSIRDSFIKFYKSITTDNMMECYGLGFHMEDVVINSPNNKYNGMFRYVSFKK
jgi:hypothetical protein